MKVETPAAWHFIMQDEIYLLKTESSIYKTSGDAGLEKATALPEVIEPTGATALETLAGAVYLGNNKSAFLVLVHYPEQEFIAGPHFTALENTLKRKGLDVGDVAILNMARHNSFNFESLVSHFKPHKLLILGKNALPEGLININMNSVMNISDASLLYTYDFDEMIDSNERKKAFWDTMKVF